MELAVEAVSSTSGTGPARTTSRRRLSQRRLDLGDRLVAGAEVNGRHAQLAGRGDVVLDVVDEQALRRDDPPPSRSRVSS